jgi:hypothetical protein
MIEWTKQECEVEAKKHTTLMSFQMRAYDAYKTAYDNNWLVEICGHMKSTIHFPGREIPECLKAGVARYVKKTEAVSLSAKSDDAHVKSENIVSLPEKFDDERVACEGNFHRPAGYWTFERCQDEIKRLSAGGTISQTKLRRLNRSVYNAMIRNGWFQRVQPKSFPHTRGCKKAKSEWFQKNDLTTMFYNLVTPFGAPGTCVGKRFVGVDDTGYFTCTVIGDYRLANAKTPKVLIVADRPASEHKITSFLVDAHTGGDDHIQLLEEA